jgi:hypothetical protein
LIPGDGEYFVPILDPLFVSGLTVNDGIMEIVFRNMFIGGLQGLDLLSIR